MAEFRLGVKHAPARSAIARGLIASLELVELDAQRSGPSVTAHADRARNARRDPPVGSSRIAANGSSMVV